MINPEQNKSPSTSRLTLIAIGLMVLVGAIIVFLDRNQVRQVWGKAQWNYLGVALAFVAISYLLGSISMVVMWRAFGVGLNKFHLLQVAFVSNALSTLIGIPASLALRLLVLGHHGVTPGQIVGSSLLLAYFKNLVFFVLIPISLVYIIFTYPLVFGGVAIMVLISLILIVIIAVAIFILYNTRIRTFVLRVLSKIWHFVTHKDIEKRLTDFGDALTKGILQLKYKPKFGWLLAALILGDVATMIAGLFFGFKALGIPVHLVVLITSFNFGITLTVISFIPGDMGVQEASIAGILAIFGVPFSLGVLGAMLFRVTYYFVPFVFSLGFYWSLLRKMHVKQH